jgi:hypothetical protein
MAKADDRLAVWDALARNDIEQVCRDYVHESDEKNYDREAVLRDVRSGLRNRI